MEATDAIIVLSEAVRNVLEQEHNDRSRCTLMVRSDRLNFACPYCGDSATDAHKKRGNIFLASLTFHCFNCDKHTTAFRFLKDFRHLDGLDEDVKTLLRERVSVAGRVGARRINARLKVDVVFSNRIREYTIPREAIMRRYRLQEVYEVPHIRQYLEDRHQFDFWRMGWNEFTQRLFIMNSDPETQAVLGIQTRSFDATGKFPKYVTYNHSRVRSDCGLDAIPEEDADTIDRLSMIYRILEADFSRSVYVFEGPLDSFLMTNAIALSGAKGEVPFDYDDYRFIFDHDHAGRKKALQKINEGYRVFLWSKFLTEAKVGLNRHRKIDYNDVVTWAAREKAHLPSVDKYFSEQKTDVMWL